MNVSWIESNSVLCLFVCSLFVWTSNICLCNKCSDWSISTTFLFNARMWRCENVKMETNKKSFQIVLCFGWFHLSNTAKHTYFHGCAHSRSDLWCFPWKFPKSSKNSISSVSNINSEINSKTHFGQYFEKYIAIDTHKLRLFGRSKVFERVL